MLLLIAAGSLCPYICGVTANTRNFAMYIFFLKIQFVLYNTLHLKNMITANYHLENCLFFFFCLIRDFSCVYWSLVGLHYMLYFVVDTGLNINIWKFSFICCTFWCQKHNQYNWLRMFSPYLYFVLANVISALTTEWGICIGELLPGHIISIDFDDSHSQPPQAGPQAVPCCSKACSPCPPFREQGFLCLKAHPCSDKCGCFRWIWGQLAFHSIRQKMDGSGPCVPWLWMAGTW